MLESKLLGKVKLAALSAVVSLNMGCSVLKESRPPSFGFPLYRSENIALEAGRPLNSPSKQGFGGALYLILENGLFVSYSAHQISVNPRGYSSLKDPDVGVQNSYSFGWCRQFGRKEQSTTKEYICSHLHTARAPEEN